MEAVGAALEKGVEAEEVVRRLDGLYFYNMVVVQFCYVMENRLRISVFPARRRRRGEGGARRTSIRRRLRTNATPPGFLLGCECLGPRTEAPIPLPGL